jgi:hypothetical protein
MVHKISALQLHGEKENDHKMQGEKLLENVMKKSSEFEGLPTRKFSDRLRFSYKFRS